MSLGPQYRGAHISRKALTADSGSESGSDQHEDSDDSQSDEDDEHDGEEEGHDSFDDPDMADLEADQARVQGDPEIDSDQAFGESDEERFKDFKFRGSRTAAAQNGLRDKRRPAAADFMDLEAEETDASEGSDGDDLENGLNSASDLQDEDDLEDGDDLEGEDEDDDVDMQQFGRDADDDFDEDQTGSSEDDEAVSDEEENKAGEIDSSGAALRRLGHDTQRSVMSNISTGAKIDIKKGLAVREQRKVFDGLLNIRIRLQKAVVAANSFHVIDPDEDAGEEPYKTAEQAAINLWNSINECRAEISQAARKDSTSVKRPRTIDVTKSTEEIWALMEQTEKPAAKRRKTTLDKWERKTSRAKGKMDSTTSKSLLTSLEEQLAEPERFIKRAQTPRSGAPIQLARKLNQDPEIYDDVDFYQRLLKELVDQRTVDPTSDPTAGVATVRLAAVSEAKARKHVDRRASKGRKMRFTIHEKIQNFMAPEDRRAWEQPAIDRFFGNLFGQKLALNEEDSSADDADVLGAEEEGLRLFRS